MGQEGTSFWAHAARRNPVRRWLRRYEPADIRDRLSDANDGILTIAGTSLGLAGAEIGVQTSYTVLVITAAVGTLSTLSVQLNQEWNGYEQEQDAVAREERLLMTDRAGQVQELIEWFEDKGVSPDTARQMSAELSDDEALDIQLALEYGIEDPVTPRQVVSGALVAGLTFLLGAALPIAMQYFVPLDFRIWLTMTIAGISLTITAIAFSVRGHYRVPFAIVRGLCMGIGMLTLTYYLGDLLM
ncbi:VIT1/CCC1 transporter family protein [Gordonia sp. (in: high G+C Gram-positive bacteria)]|uniref:VIT1/CCC1 transporter family protein n=1 Tax=Gordonia sp. (in: high G+C Gram-positive bacteria) TaxID=84139 RepID=UPI003C73E405